MSNYYLLVPQIAEAGLVTRLQQLVDLDPIDVNAAVQAVTAGDICFASGEVMMAMSGNQREQLTRGILGQGVNLVIIPPLPRGPLPSLLYEVESPESYVAPFGPVRIIEEGLRSRCGLEEMTILFNQVIRLRTGKAIVVTSSGESVVSRHQLRSTWGQLLYMTLLLGSTSTRSRRAHRVAFAQGLVSWLTQLSPPSSASPTTEPRTTSDLSYELPIMLLAAHLAEQDGALTERLLRQEVNRLRGKLAEEDQEFHFVESLSRLSNEGILSPLGEGRWRLDPERLAEEINRRHLASYLRRLR